MLAASHPLLEVLRRDREMAMLVITFQSGERREIPRATSASIVGDRLHVLGKNGQTLALFPAPEVYLCSKGSIPTIPA
jgi:hypothetical protein